MSSPAVAGSRDSAELWAELGSQMAIAGTPAPLPTSPVTRAILLTFLELSFLLCEMGDANDHTHDRNKGVLLIDKAVSTEPGQGLQCS